MCSKKNFDDLLNTSLKNNEGVKNGMLDWSKTLTEEYFKSQDLLNDFHERIKADILDALT